MEIGNEIFSAGITVPFNVELKRLGEEANHWHQIAELIFVLRGTLCATMASYTYNLHADDILLINPNSVHSLQADDCILIAIQVDFKKYILPAGLSPNSLYFECNSTSGRPSEDYKPLKSIIANIIKINTHTTKVSDLINHSLAYSLLAELVASFRSSHPARDVTQKHMERVSRLVGYIHDHYSEQLTLAHIAEKEHLSEPYLSNFFSKYIGMPFSAYYTDLRLLNATNDLVYTDKSVELIALGNGFSDARSFVRAFRKKNGCIPSQYRKNIRAKQDVAANKAEYNLLDIHPDNFLEALAPYLQSGNQPEIMLRPRKARKRMLRTNDVDVANPSAGQLNHTFKSFVTVNTARDLLNAHVQQMLIEAQKEIGFTYIQFHGILSDDMLVCLTGKQGETNYSFVLINQLLDFILSIGLRPLIQFSFMPQALATEPSKYLTASRFIISEPKKIEEWSNLINAFLVNIQQRYGQEEIQQWMFSLWNKPDTSAALFGTSHDESFYTMYETTYKCVKGFDKHLVFGSPSLVSLAVDKYYWADEFLAWNIRNGMRPDFINLHYFSNNFGHILRPPYYSSNRLRALSTNENHLNEYIAEVKARLGNLGLSNLPVYLTEWNLTTSHHNPVNDICYKACYIAKCIVENFDLLDAMGYSCLTDLTGEIQPVENAFHGGLGLFTYNGIKKSAYYAVQMISHIGDIFLARGKGYLVTRHGLEIQLICYNYEHIDDLFASGEAFDLTPTNRYTVFSQQTLLEFMVPLVNLSDGKYQVKEYIINRKSGSSFDNWVNMGAPPLGGFEVDVLKKISHPGMQYQTVEVSDQKMTYRAVLEPHEVRLVKIRKAYV